MIVFIHPYSVGNDESKFWSLDDGVKVGENRITNNHFLDQP